MNDIVDFFRLSTGEIGIQRHNFNLIALVGDVVEKWEVRGCEILEVDFGELSYEKNKIATCSILIKPKTAKLVF